MPARLPSIIRTARLKLRPIQASDVEPVFRYANDPVWARYLPVPQPYTYRDAQAFVTGMLNLVDDAHPTWMIEADEVVGAIDLHLHLVHRSAVLGYSVARTHWGRGIAPEAAQAVVDTAFSSDLGLNRIAAVTDVRNQASIRVMEKLGMTREGQHRQHRLVRGEIVDDYCYAIVRCEWQAQHAPVSRSRLSPHTAETTDRLDYSSAAPHRGP